MKWIYEIRKDRSVPGFYDLTRRTQSDPSKCRETIASLYVGPKEHVVESHFNSGNGEMEEIIEWLLRKSKSLVREHFANYFIEKAI